MGRPISRVNKVEVAGPLAPFAAAFESRLDGLGYTALTTTSAMRSMARLSRWLDAGGMTVADLTSERVEQYVHDRRTGSSSPRSLTALLGLLDSLGVLPANPPGPPCSAMDALLASFHRYLLVERALAPSTATAYLDRARRFLSGCTAAAGLAELTTADVTRAVLRESAAAGSVGSAQFFVVAQRAFLRFCFIEGLVPGDLSAAALTVTGRRRPGPPAGISQADADALLGSCDRRRSQGRRDYAVLITLLRLGLRAGEVASLRLEDLDWRAGEIVVQARAAAPIGSAARRRRRRDHRLPATRPAGDLPAGSVPAGDRTDRSTGTRRDLLDRAPRLHPRGPGPGGSAPAAAHDGLRDGQGWCPLPEISQVLRHRSLVSTAIYARVDLDQLRALAQPWPESPRPPQTVPPCPAQPEPTGAGR